MTVARISDIVRDVRTQNFVVFSIDRSGNQAVSREYQVKLVVKTYLPAVLRGR